MNKQIISKLIQFLKILEQKIIDNIDFFIDMKISFKSGTKVFEAFVTLNDNKINFKFNGKTEIFEITNLSNVVFKEALNYDSATILYCERGLNIIVTADNKNVLMKTAQNTIEDIKKSHSETSKIGNRNYYIKLGYADNLLKEIGILGENGKLKNDMIRKYNQIDHFVELIDDTIRNLLVQDETITILDCGCGKSYLSFVLNYYIKEVLKKNCYFIGLDYSDTVIEASKKTAQNLNCKNMEFLKTDIKNYEATRKIHMVISLHACDTATDQALALAINNNVHSIVSVPCCQKEILSQYSFNTLDGILKHGILKAKLADILTDGVRSLILESLGYSVSIIEYISPLETPKNIMLRASKTSDINKKVLEEYNTLKKLLNIEPTLEKLIHSKIFI